MKFRIFIVSFLAILILSSCKSDNLEFLDVIQVRNSVIVLNEGNFGKKGSLSYFDYPDMLDYDGIYANEDQKGFGQTSCFAKLTQLGLFVVSKDKPFLSVFRNIGGGVTYEFIAVLVDKLSEGEQAHAVELVSIPNIALTKTSVIENQPFLFLTTSKNIHRYNPSLKKIDKTYFEEEQGFYEILFKDNTLFVIGDKGLYAINDKVEHLGAATGGFTIGKDGSLWASNYDKESDKTELLKIDAKTLEIERITISANIKTVVYDGTWRPTSLIASKRENAIFFIENVDIDNYKLFKYDVDRKELKTLLTLDETKESFSASALVYCPFSDEINALVKVPGWNDLEKNAIITIDAKTGNLNSKVEYNGLYFPTMLILGRDEYKYVYKE